MLIPESDGDQQLLLLAVLPLDYPGALQVALPASFLHQPGLDLWVFALLQLLEHVPDHCLEDKLHL